MPSHVELVREALSTGDFALAGLPDGAVVERKTVSIFWRARLRAASDSSASLPAVGMSADSL